MKKLFKVLLWTLVGIVALPIIMMCYLYLSADMGEPELSFDPTKYVAVNKSDTLVCGNSYMRYDSCGLWELYVVGSGEVRGAKQGVLTKGLMKYQEDVFINQIRNIIPSDSYLSFLRTFIIIFNRNLGRDIPLEYRQEIASMSQYCTHEYDAIGTPYERQLNYHAAHDIGHTMQQYMLVGCSSFGVWGKLAQDSSMVVGRNFDFYVGDDFAKNKLMTFAVPDNGYRYASIGWAGMVGVLSGMNECGLTVTINAAKGAIPTSAAIPISILTREILQYASNIKEAYEIALSRKTFVSESILVGSTKDNKCAIIEKTPQRTELYFSEKEMIICTNHFQSEAFMTDSYNVENIENSDSKYRYNRLEELLQQHKQISYTSAVEILRNRFGKGGTDIGIGNEMSLNQSIAHHSVVFMPKEKLMWVSTSPWQSGTMVCYDLKGFFEGTSKPYCKLDMEIAEDSSFMRHDYPLLIKYRKCVKEINDAIKHNEKLSVGYINNFLALNEHHYYTYRIIGDYYAAMTEDAKAIEMYKRSLNCAIPYKNEQEEIEKLIIKLRK